MKRIQKLMDKIYVFEDISYRSSKEVYQAIYADWRDLQLQKPELSRPEITRELADKYHFSFRHIGWIVHIMENDPAGEYFRKKRKLTKVETFNRDKALYIDYLRWTGSKKSFCTFAAEKYNLSECSVYAILQYCLFADPNRYEME